MQIRELLDELLTSLETGPLISAVRHFEAKPAVFAPFPSSLDPRIVEALKARGVEQLYSHQAKAVEAVAKGEHLVVVTPTASGKTLCYNLPVLQALVQQPEARVLYLFPTKALAQDQLAELTELAKSLPDMRMFTYDGDTPQDARRSVRARANLVLTNPDMLHSGILPHHTKWVNLFQNLKYVVIDELHAYRGVFGSHLANVLRRLKRICRHYGATPQFIMASATIANPGDLAQRLTGERVVELNESGAPTGEKTFMVYNPPVVNPELGIRAPYLGEASKLAARFLKKKVATIVFCQSRLSTEVVLASIKKWCWPRSRRWSRTRPATPASCAATAAATCRCAAARSSRGSARARCSGWSRPARSSSASTSATSTLRCSRGIRAPSPRCGSRRAGRAGAAASPPR